MLHLEEIKTDSNGTADSQQNINNLKNEHPIETVHEEELLINKRVEKWYNRAKDSMSGFQ